MTELKARPRLKLWQSKPPAQMRGLKPCPCRSGRGKVCFSHLRNDPVPPAIPFFDGHNDTLLRLVTSCPDIVAAFGQCSGHGQLDLALAAKGGFAGGLFACFVPSDGDRDAGFSLTEDGYTVVMPEAPSLDRARSLTDTMIACAHQLAAEMPDRIRLCRTVSDIQECLTDDVLALVLHLEGAEAIGDDLEGLDVYYRRGVRSIGPVWSRPNRFGTGAPFRFPGSPDTGPGLTEAGFALVRACDERGVMLDVSHLNAAGFWDVARTSRAPLVATHSNVHAICPMPRNLVDGQLRAIRDSGGLVGVSLSVSELRPDGHNSPEMPLSDVLRHLDHLLEMLGPDGVAIGSDFDGAVLPQEISDAGGLPSLAAAMVTHGYDDALLRKICLDNWMRVLKRCWH